MPKLHELLAVESNLENQSNKVRSELMSTFEKKRHLFEEKRITFQSNTEGQPLTTESQLDIQSTVAKELEWVQKFLVKSIDASYQVAEANTVARADVVDEEGNVILSQVPATSLLELEKRVAEIQALVTAIPTLDPAKGFTLDPSRGIYKARDVNKHRTQKVVKVLVKYEATKEHPAQTELINQDVPVGKLLEQEWSGLITPSEKAEYINRVETLARAIRSARSRANETSVDTSKKIGNKLLKYVFGS